MKNIILLLITLILSAPMAAIFIIAFIGLIFVGMGPVFTYLHFVEEMGIRPLLAFPSAMGIYGAALIIPPIFMVSLDENGDLLMCSAFLWVIIAVIGTVFFHDIEFMKENF